MARNMLIGSLVGLAIDDSTSGILGGATAGFVLTSSIEGDKRIFAYTVKHSDGSFETVAVDRPDLNDPSFDGYWIAASWVLTGEMRSYNKKSGTFGSVPIARTVYQGGKGAWEVRARWSSIDLSDGLVEGGEMDVASLGVNWWLTPIFSGGMDYRYIWNTRLGVEGTSSGLNTRVLLLLE